MKKSLWLSMFALVPFGLSATVCLAQGAEAVSGSGMPDGSELREYYGPELELPAGYVKRFVIGYMSSIAPSSPTIIPRTATVISITNQSTSTCGTAVDWKQGFSSANAGTTVLVLGPKQTGEHCSRSLPMNVASCNATATPALLNHEGNATVASVSVPSACVNIAVDARVYYFRGQDYDVAAVADVKVIKGSVTNKGD